MKFNKRDYAKYLIDTYETYNEVVDFELGRVCLKHEVLEYSLEIVDQNGPKTFNPKWLEWAYFGKCIDFIDDLTEEMWLKLLHYSGKLNEMPKMDQKGPKWK